MCNHSAVKWHEVSMIDYVRDMTAEKSHKYGQYGLLDLLLILFVLMCIVDSALFPDSSGFCFNGQ